MPVVHARTSTVAPTSDASLVSSTDWNDPHVVDVDAATEIHGILSPANGGFGADLSSGQGVVNMLGGTASLLAGSTGDVLLNVLGTWTAWPFATLSATFLPYTGATGDVNLGIYDLTAASILTDTVIAENLYFNSVGYDALICTSPTSGLLAAVNLGANLSFSAGTLAVTNAALTRTNDTNVTLTLGGSPNSALLAATSMTLGWAGQLGLSRGGSNANLTAVNGGIVYSTASALAISAAGTSGQLLQSNGAGAPSWVSASSFGVTSITGAANQISASASTGAVALSLPSSVILPGTLQLGGAVAGELYAVNNVGTLSSRALTGSDVGGRNYTSTASTGAGPSPQVTGWSFTVGSSDIFVTQLCVADTAWSAGTLDVGLYAIGGAQLATANVARSDTLTGKYRCKTISTVKLTAGSTYAILIAQGLGATGDTIIFTVNGGTIGSGITFVSGRYIFPQSGLPSTDTTANDASNTYATVSLNFQLAQDVLKTENLRVVIDNTPVINTMVSGTSLIQSSVKFISSYSGAASANSSYFLGSGNDGGLLQLFGAGGTIASPTALTTDSRMGGVFGRGYAATGYSNAVAGVTFHAESTFTDTSTPTYIAFATTASGATTRTEAMRITSAGNVMIGTSTSAWAGNPRFQAKGNGLFFSTDASAVGILLYDKRATEKYWYLAHKPSDSSFYINHWNGGSDTYPFTITTGGNVGVNTTATAKLHIVKSLYETPSLTFGADCATIIRGENAELACGFGYPSYAGMYLQARYSTNTSLPLFLNPVGGNVAIATNDTSRRLVVAGVGATNDKLLYLRQTNDYGYSFNLDSSSTGRLYVYGVNAGAETSAILTLDRTNTFFGIGETAPYFKCMIREQTTSPQLSLVYSGSGATTNKELELGYNGATGSGYGWIQAIHNGTAYTPINLNPYGGGISVGTLTGTALCDVAGFIRSTASTGTPSSGSGVEILYNSGNGYVQAYDRGASAYRTLYVEGSGVVLNPNSGGNVGIGNTGATPRAKLEVVGDIWTDWSDRFIGTVYQTGSAYKMGIGTTTGVRALDLIAMSADSSSIRFWTGSTPSVNAYIDHVSNVVLGNQSALATNATNGFVYIRTCAGTPTGAPTAFTGHVAMVFDTTNNKLWCYNGAWKGVVLS